MSLSGVPSVLRPAVLAVDDYEANLMVLAALLEPLRIDVVTSSTAFEAVALARERVFAAILMDVHLPTLGGREAANLIHRCTLNRKTPILFLTGDDDIGETLRSEGHAVLAKPYRCADLIDRVSQLVRFPLSHAAVQ
jgi:two-component system sensor histidine kinase BarA